MDMNTPEPPRKNTTTVQRAADKSTGEQPMELFITDEHTENYLALKAGGDSDRGLVTGVLGGMDGVGGIGLSFIIAIQGDFDYIMLALGLSLFLVPFMWEILRPLPLPILFNRRMLALIEN